LVVKNGSNALFQSLFGHSGTCVGDRDQDILAGLEIGLLAAISVVQICVAGLYSDLAAIRHGVAGVDCEVDDCCFQFGRIRFGKP
jgi:hypothetical protein